MANALVTRLAENVGLEPADYWRTIFATIMPQGVTTEQAYAFLQVAEQYNLNPLTREIYAFPSKGGVQPVVSVDGWIKLANQNHQFDGLKHTDNLDDNGDLVSVTCEVHRKDRAQPITATEYMSECARGTEPWKKWPRRMLRHKATIQAIRYAFGFAGIIDPDEAERFDEATMEDVTETKSATAAKTADLAEQIAAAEGKASNGDGADPDPHSAAAPSSDIEDAEFDSDNLWASGQVNHIGGEGGLRRDLADADPREDVQ